MLSEHQPFVDPRHFLSSNEAIDASVLLSQLTRLRELCSNHHETLAYSMQFQMHPDCVAIVVGTLTGQFEWLCTRCLDKYTEHVNLTFELAIAASEDMLNKLDDGSDSVILNADGLLDVQALLEDEVLLAYAYGKQHPQCEPQKTLIEVDLDALMHEEADENPFAALKDYKVKP